MRVILGTDSLQQPLTGIGRYTLGLAQGLLASPEVREVRGFDLGCVHALEHRLQIFAAGQDPRPTLITRIRRLLANSAWATRIYQRHLSAVGGRRLQRQKDAIFHSPNFHLPKGVDRSIVTIHDLSFIHHPEYHPPVRVRWMHGMVPEALAVAARVICVSAFTRAAVMREFGVPAERLTVIHHGVDRQFQPLNPSASAATLMRWGLEFGHYFLCVATLEPRKNIDGLIRAYLRLPASARSRHPLVLVGSRGWRCESLERQIAGAAGAGVRYLGYVPELMLPPLYSGALLTCYPSHYEGFGLPVLEAQACGSPVICSRQAALQEIAGPLVRLVDPADDEQLSTALRSGLDDAAWREASHKAGPEQARPFTWDACIARTLQAYRSAV